MISRSETIKVRAVRAMQAGTEVYMFVLAPEILGRVAEIPRLGRSEEGDIEGFQRPEIRSHVASIAEYLTRGDVLFPNPIILALAPGSKFRACRGTKPTGKDARSEAGTLEIRVRPGCISAWVVDGQQRALAIAQSAHPDLPIPIVGFVSGDVALHREQFILVNKAKPLSPRLVDVLLPSIDVVLPRDLSARRLPSALCNALNEGRQSPFRGLIKRPDELGKGVITDSALIRVLKRSISNPLGALAPLAPPGGPADTDAMYALLVAFWGAAKDVFPSAWGLPPEQSRLMHAAGIEVMGYLMDRVMSRPTSSDGAYALARRSLEALAPFCRWTEGYWEAIGTSWNEIECTGKSIARLRDYLIQLEMFAAGRYVA